MFEEDESLLVKGNGGHLEIKLLSLKQAWECQAFSEVLSLEGNSGAKIGDFVKVPLLRLWSPSHFVNARFPYSAPRPVDLLWRLVTTSLEHANDLGQDDKVYFEKHRA